MNMESIYEYGSRAGFWRLFRMFTERNMAVDGVRRRHRDGSQSAGCRRDARGRLGDRDARLQVDRLSRYAARDRGASISPKRSASTPRSPARGRSGFIRGARSINTIPLGMEEGGFVYCADTYADDLPYYIEGPRGRS